MMATSTIKRAKMKARDVARILMEMSDDSDLSSLSDSEVDDDARDQPLTAAASDSDSDSDAEPQAIPTTSCLPAENDNADSSCSEADIDSDSDTEGYDVQPQSGSVTSRSGKLWYDAAPASRRRGPEDIVRNHSGLTAAGKSAESVADCFRLFVTSELVQLVVQHTNEEGERVYAEYNKKHSANQKEYIPFDEDEVYACIGLLILAGVLKGKHEHYRDLWGDVGGRAPFIATLSRDRFQLFIRLCRFDDKTTRDQRKPSDNMAHVREMFDTFNATLTKPYVPSPCLTVDEQLVTFRGRARFKVFIPSKPGKYGILLRMMTDASSRYVLNILPYAGKPDDGQREPAGSAQRLVHKLVLPYKGSGRNVTMDRFYTSVELAEDLLKDKLTIVGTMNASRRDIPDKMRPNKIRAELSSSFIFTRDLTMVSYVPKKNKSVILLSSMHHAKEISNEDHRKPEIILFYNSTKGGVDIVDQMVRHYSCRVKTRRWPLALFMNCLDIAGVNALLIWLCKEPSWNATKSHRRRLFLRELGLQLIRPHMERRSLQRGLNSLIQQAMSTTLGRPVQSTSTGTSAAQSTCRGRCYVCVRQTYGKGHKKRKDKVRRQQQRCTKCLRHICNEHCVQVKVCAECRRGESDVE